LKSDFESFLSVGRGQEVSVTPENEQFLISLGEELENDEVLKVIEDKSCEVTERNAIDRLRRRLDIGPEISFIAMHFKNISKSDLKNVDVSILLMILSSNSLKIPGEDWLLDLICEFVEDGTQYFGLFEHVRFEWLSVESMHRFCEIGAELLSEMNLGVWKSLFGRCVLPISLSGSNEQMIVQSIRFSPKWESSLEGIVSYLMKDQHVADGNVIGGTSSSTYQRFVAPKCVTDLRNPNSFFQLMNFGDSWLCYDFTSMKIMATHYAILSCPRGASHCHPRNWCVEVSDGKGTWMPVDEHCDCNDLCGQCKLDSMKYQSLLCADTFGFGRLNQV
jgi:hypothetical protein